MTIPRLSTPQSVGVILITFLAWGAISTGWFLCGVRNLCIAQAAETTISTVTEQPVAEIYTLSGSAGEILIMLLVSFVLGTFLGRLLSIERKAAVTEDAPPIVIAKTPTLEPRPAPVVINLPHATEKPLITAPAFTPRPTRPDMNLSKPKPPSRQFNTSWSKPPSSRPETGLI
ncbi:MAG: hypothetical protein AAB421_00780 [Patescibacteria group bacterium]